MKPKKTQEELIAYQKEKEKEKLELHKAVAQAWHSHLTKAKVATSEFDARKLNFQFNPSRFKLEAMKMLKAKQEVERANCEFYQSLWDSYEIVAISKKLENGLLFDYRFDDFMKVDVMNRKKLESKSSLRNLFKLKSSRSRRFNFDGIDHR